MTRVPGVFRPLAFAACCLAAGCSGIFSAVEAIRTDALVGVVANVECATAAESEPVRKALRHFREAGVDAVVMLGNLTRDGLPSQYEALAQAVRSVYGIGDVRFVFVRGERDGEDAAAGNALSPFGTVCGAEGGVFDVDGFRFGASYRRGRFEDAPIAFRAHGKAALTEETGFYPRASRSVYAGSLSGIDLHAGFIPVPGMDKASQGLLVRAFGSSARVERLDFSVSGPEKGDRPSGRTLPAKAYAEPVAEAWTVPFARAPDEPDRRPPAFPKGVRLVLVRGFADPGQSPVVTLRWPSALARYGGARAAHYEVTVHAGDPTSTRPLFRSYHRSPHWHQRDVRDAAPVEAVLYESAFPRPRGARELVVAVTAVSSLGARSEPLTARMALEAP